VDRVGVFFIRADHPALPGHFPGRPIVPGVVLLDEALAAIATVFGLSAPIRLVRVKFVAPVLPGERVTVMVDPPVNGTMRFACVAGDRPILSAAVKFDMPVPVL